MDSSKTPTTYSAEKAEDVGGGHKICRLLTATRESVKLPILLVLKSRRKVKRYNSTKLVAFCVPSGHSMKGNRTRALGLAARSGHIRAVSHVH
jgi:hypothetical protein